MEPALACIRFFHFAATMFLFGAGIFLNLFAPPRLRAVLGLPLRPALIAASVVGLASAVLWLGGEGASMTGAWASAIDPQILSDVLTSTAFGAVWLWRLPLLCILVAVVIYKPATKLQTLVAALALASLALVDHAAMQTGGIGVAHRANDALHLILTGGWLGSLTPFALCLVIARHAEFGEETGTAMLRFSGVGHFAVIAILATGAANVAMTGGRLPWPPASPYRVLLAAKIVVVALMLALAIVNRYVLLPAIEREPERAHMLRRLSLVELALALTAVALVSYFGLLDPA
jgi:copper resistance protein D